MADRSLGQTVDGSEEQVATSGNYQTYYGYREVNERMAWLRSVWFDRCKVLDIGCNDGRVLLHVSEALGARYALGIDSDASLIDKAKMALEARYKEISRFPYCATTIKPLQVFPLNTDFRQEDFVSGEHDDTGYDVIMCLSVSKWIHLNYGDTGILTLFDKVHRLLVEGGLFIFEYQGWLSYKKRKHLTPEIKAVYQSIEIKPVDFERLLMERYGFEVVDRRGPSAAEARGFDRPCVCLRKPIV